MFTPYYKLRLVIDWFDDVKIYPVPIFSRP